MIKQTNKLNPHLELRSTSPCFDDIWNNFSGWFSSAKTTQMFLLPRTMGFLTLSGLTPAKSDGNRCRLNSQEKQGKFLVLYIFLKPWPSQIQSLTLLFVNRNLLHLLGKNNIWIKCYHGFSGFNLSFTEQSQCQSF